MGLLRARHVRQRINCFIFAKRLDKCSRSHVSIAVGCTFSPYDGGRHARTLRSYETVSLRNNTCAVRIKVTVRRVRSTIVAVEEQECVYVWLAKRVRRTVNLWHVWLYCVLAHCHINVTIFG